METAIKSARKIPVPALIFAAIALLALIAGVAYLNRPAPAVSSESTASDEAKAYLPNLELSDVKIDATKNFMQQQVVEIQGKISNHGPRVLASIEVYCLFLDAAGKQVYRERLPVVHGLGPQDTRAFRLPFDNLPDTWNEAMPRLVIAKIVFDNGKRAAA